MASTSYLNAVNILLAVIGEAPIAAVDEGHVTGVMADKILEETSRAVQSHGWRWNTEPFTLSPDNAGYLNAPANTLGAHFPRSTSSTDLVLRNGRIYDLKKRSYTFDGSLELELVLQLPWEDLPEEARRYITIKSARLFADRLVGDQAMHTYTQQEEYEAKASLWRAETGQQYRTIFDNTDSHFATWRAFGA
jgi:hypothetical protein